MDNSWHYKMYIRKNNSIFIAISLAYPIIFMVIIHIYFMESYMKKHYCESQYFHGKFHCFFIALHLQGI